MLEMQNDPWAFGWTQILALAGLVLTLSIAIGTYRTFNRWKREKLEERRLDVALDALSIAYEAQMIFEDIQRQFVHAYEWSEMPTEGLSDGEITHRRSLYAVINRMGRHVGFFERVLSLQPKFMAVFGRDTRSVFEKFHKARHGIQIAIETLMTLDNPQPGEAELVAQLRSDIWNVNAPKAKDPGRTRRLVAEFRDDIERICSPLVNRKYQSGPLLDAKRSGSSHAN
jgi:hypothetical protein